MKVDIEVAYFFLPEEAGLRLTLAIAMTILDRKVIQINQLMTKKMMQLSCLR